MPHGSRIEHWGIFDAAEPWGPWTTVDYLEKWGALRGTGSLVYSIPTKWINEPWTDIWLVFSGAGSFDSFNLLRGVLVLQR